MKASRTGFRDLLAEIIATEVRMERIQMLRRRILTEGRVVRLSRWFDRSCFRFDEQLARRNALIQAVNIVYGFDASVDTWGPCDAAISCARDRDAALRAKHTQPLGVSA